MVVLYITMKQKQQLKKHPILPEQTNPKDETFIAWSRMSHKRRHTTCPDAEEAWNAFKGKIKPNASHRTGWQLCLATLAGAAAMLAGVLLYQHFFHETRPEDTFIALTYDDTPQHIRLKGYNQSMDISSLDSISFLSDADPLCRKQPEASVPATGQPMKGMQELSTPRGMDFKITLSDGTEVWLNAESSLVFPSAFTESHREVRLKGEAYFKVARNEQAPFIVTSDKMNVRVLGTEFNFRNYDTPHVSLVHGSVEIFRPGEKTPEARLSPGQDAWRDEHDNIQVKDIDTYAVTQWICGFFYFDHTSLMDILQELGRWYNLGVVFHNSQYLNTPIHFNALRTENIHQTIKNLNQLQKGEIKLEGKNIAVY